MRYSGYAVVDGQTERLIESGSLPQDWSAQACELHALKRALEYLVGKSGTICTDFKYAWGVVHTLGKIWIERAMTTPKGKELLHEQLTTDILTALQKPLEIAVVHVRGHQKGETREARGNQRADQEAKKAAQERNTKVYALIPWVEKPRQIPRFLEKEKNK